MLSDHKATAATPNSANSISSANANFTIVIETMAAGAAFHIDVTPNDTIAELKQKICSERGITPIEQKLFFKNHLLAADNTKLSELNIEDGSVIKLLRTYSVTYFQQRKTNPASDQKNSVADNKKNEALYKFKIEK